MRTRSIFGVLVGGVVDIVATNLFVFPVLIAAVLRLDIAHTPKAQVGTALVAILHGSVGLYGAALLAGAAASVLGGYVAAAISGRHFRLTGACSAYLCVASEVYALVAGRVHSVPRWEVLLLMPLSPLLGAVGGWLRERRARRRAAASLAARAA